MTASLVLRRPAPSASLTAVLLPTLFALAGLSALGLAPDIDLPRSLTGDAAHVALTQFQRDFGGDEEVVLASFTDDRAALPAALAQLAERVRAVPGVERVVVPIARDEGGAARLSSDVAFAAPLLSVDAAAMRVTLAPRESGAGFDATLAALESAALESDCGPWELAGPVVTESALDRASLSSLSVLVPIAALGMLCLLILGLANSRSAARVLVSSGSASSALVRAARRSPVAVVCGTLVVLVLTGGGLLRLHVESNVLRLLPADAPVRSATKRIESRLSGLTLLEVRIDGPRDRVLGDEVAVAARGLAAWIRTHPLVTHVVSPYESVGDDLPCVELPQALPAYARVEGERASTRLTVCSRTVAPGVSVRVGEDVERLARRSLEPLGVTAHVTGAAPFRARAQIALLRTRLLLFAMALALVSVALFLHLRSARLAALALATSLAPTVVAAGALGWSGAPLDAAALAAGVVGLGLAVAVTTLVLSGSRHSGASFDRSSARAVVLTAAAAVGGLAGFAASSFPPVGRFGLLLACSASVALAADLLLLPALLTLAERRRERVTQRFELSPRLDSTS